MLDKEKVESRRVALGLTAAEAAKLAGLKTKQAWSNVVNGRRGDPRLSTLERIATVLGCSPCDLITEPKKTARKKGGKK